MRTVQLYIENQRVDLFGDEEIVVTSSVQNIADISKVFTDFSQSFTIPASPNNNAIFDHYYQNDVDGTFIAKERVAARIEINNTPFREGKIQLEGAEIVENQAQSYTITFYGDFVTLKDLFGDDKLSDLDYSGINEELTGANVQTSLTSTSDLDVRYPLISSSRVWSYGDAASTDISVSGNAIDYTELFPAVKDKVIMDAIETTYGITFSGNFLSNKRFTNSFTWWKNRETASFTSEPLDLTFNPLGLSCSAALPSNAVGINEINFQYIDMATFTQPADWQSWTPNQWHNIIFHITNTSGSDTWYLDTYKNGVLNGTITGSGDTLVFVLQPNTYWNTPGLDDTFTFQLRCDASITFDFEIRYKFNGKYVNTSNVVTDFEHFCSFSTASNTITANYDFNTSAPDIKVSDWFSGTLKEFNLTCYPLEDALTYQVEPLEDYYKYGDEQNITQYVDVKSIKVDRPKLYNEINFQWQESKSFMNEAFLEVNSRPYGDLRQAFPDYDGGKYDIKLPFETLLFNKFTNENLQVGYSLTKAPDYKPYIPKPVKLYLHEYTNVDVDFHFNNGTSTANITEYVPFGQDLSYNAGNYSMNFGEEISSLTLNPVGNSLYKEYYYPYLANLFDNKTRKVTVECILPVSILTSLSLDDRILIRDKAYRIDSMSSNLTSGNVKLVLLSDWTRQANKIIFPLTPEGGGTIVVPVKPPRGGYINISAPTETQFITSSPTLPASNLSTEQEQTITVPTNSTGNDRQQTITYTAYNPDGSIAWQETVVLFQEGSSFFLLKEDGGYLLQENLDRIKL